MEHYHCPVCFEIPEQEVYQCSNGHYICNVCVKGLTSCPQCRIQYGSVQIRCRILEELLDKLTFKCVFNDKGCQQRLSRKNIAKHNKTCSFNPSNTDLCTFIGISSGGPNFNIHFATRQEIMDHFYQKHSVHYRHANNFKIYHSNFKPLVELKRSFVWAPYLIGTTGNKETSPIFLIIGKVDFPSEQLSFACINLWSPEQKKREYYDVEFTLYNEKTSFYSGWDMPAYLIEETTEMLKNNPTKIPLQFVVDHICGGTQNDLVIAAVIFPSASPEAIKCGYKKFKSSIMPIYKEDPLSHDVKPIEPNTEFDANKIFLFCAVIIIAVGWLIWYIIGMLGKP